ncbi:hypothetical protein E4U54_003702, partial [Claviceps lovelessii]
MKSAQDDNDEDGQGGRDDATGKDAARAVVDPIGKEWAWPRDIKAWGCIRNTAWGTQHCTYLG